MDKEQTPGNNRVENIDKAHSEALVADKQGKILASHVLEMVNKLETEDRAKVGTFPNRYKGDIDTESVTLAANAELQARDEDLKIDIYNAAVGNYDAEYVNRVVVTEVDGEKIPTSELYKLRSQK